MSKQSVFEKLELEQQMAIRYHLRSSGWAGDYDARCNEIANDDNLLHQLTLAYRKYAGTTNN